ncbi:MAG: hypothetical protein ACREFX_12735 [Opitutaceae bacterium]
MSHVVRVFTLGAVCALAAHLVWYRLNRPTDDSGLEGRLAWMKTELRVSDVQLARIVAIHRSCRPRLKALAERAARLRQEDAAFEEARVQTDRVDFLKFAAYVRRERALDQACEASLHELVAASGEVMTSEQRARYVRLLAPALVRGS